MQKDAACIAPRSKIRGPVDMRACRRAREKRKGFTLVEVLVSILILSIVLAAVLKLKELESMGNFGDLVDSSDAYSLDGKDFNVVWIVEEETVANGETVGKLLNLQVTWESINGNKTLEVKRVFNSSSKNTRSSRLGQELELEEGKPGYGYGDKIHGHTGPPGQQGD
jgi:prepilin-type N-terminal cleavage/methylation domain-containing protein